MRPLIFLPYMLGALLLAVPAAAQPGEQAQSDRCKVELPDKNSEQQKPAGNNLSDTLEPCGGVLKPPPTGDQGMAAPPPDEGRTPVIKPGEVPPQPPKQ
ncbi:MULTISPECIES: hypothetical protein [unclassified Mesorhizobium]|uniref:hypothetical protein n=1 Tax=unclassified Mesorhizobium TaxID=325217 RepID=UPI00333A4687